MNSPFISHILHVYESHLGDKATWPGNTGDVTVSPSVHQSYCVLLTSLTCFLYKKIKYFIVYDITVVPLFPPLALHPAAFHSHSQSLIIVHACGCCMYVL